MKKALGLIALLLVISCARAITLSEEVTIGRIDNVMGEAYTSNSNEGIIKKIQDVINEWLDQPIEYEHEDWKLVQRLKGEVSIQKDGEWVRVWTSALIKDGTLVMTGKTGKVRIVLADDSSIILGPNTIVDVKEFQITQTRRDKINLFFGKIRTSIKYFMEGGYPIEITTPHLNGISARGTKFTVEVNKENETISVYEGEVEMNNPLTNTSIIIKTGEQAVAYTNGSIKILPINQEPFEIQLVDPCWHAEFTGVKCAPNPKQEIVFVTNNFVKQSSANNNTIIITDEEGVVDGFYKIDSLITFTPSRPLFGAVNITLKGGENGVCNIDNSCLEEDKHYNLTGVKKTIDWGKNKPPFELIPAPTPLQINRSIIIKNNGHNTVNDVELSTISFKTIYPHTFIKLLSVTPEIPYEVLEGENNIIRFNFSDVGAYENLTFVNKYTSPEKGIESNNSMIINLGTSIIGNESNPLWKAYMIHDWITRTIRYDFEKCNAIKKGEVVTTGAVETLLTGKGTCDDYAKLFVALVRSVGVPSRYVTIRVQEGEELGWHAAAEIYTQRYGWLPVNPTWSAFLTTSPSLLVHYRQDGTFPWVYALSKGGNDLNVSISASMSAPLNYGEEWWEGSFNDTFFKDLYELVLISKIRSDLRNALEEYNLYMNKSLFTVPEDVNEQLNLLIKQAIDAYEDKKYEGLQGLVQNTIITCFNDSLNALLAISEELKKFASQEFIDYAFVETKDGQVITKGLNETLSELNNITNKISLIKELMNDEKFFNAFNNLSIFYANEWNALNSLWYGFANPYEFTPYSRSVEDLNFTEDSYDSGNYSLSVEDLNFTEDSYDSENYSLSVESIIENLTNLDNLVINYEISELHEAVFGFVFLAVLITVFIFWIWAFMDCVKRKDIKWALIVFLFFAFGAVVYLILKPKNK